MNSLKSSTIVMQPKSATKSLVDKLKSLSAKSTQNIILDDSVSNTDSPIVSNSISNYIRYGVIIIILAFFGLNIFSALGLLTDNLADFFRPILVFFGYSIGETTRQTIDTSAEGTKAIVDTTTKSIDSAIDILEKKIDPERASTMKALNNAKHKPMSNILPEPDESDSRTQLSKSSGKSGYCYIGEDRGFRSCIEVKEDSKCMSGDIFPSKEICINPNLRI